MVITATEFKANLGRYLDSAGQKDIFITRNGKVIAKLSNPSEGKVAILDSLVGLAARSELTAKDARAERLARQ